MGKNVNPCEGCTQCICDYRRCDPYKKWLVAAWKEFRRYAQHGYWECGTQNGRKFTYEHPDMIRRYLQSGPCGLCECADICEIPCESYWRWWDARMVWLKWILQNPPQCSREGRR